MDKNTNNQQLKKNLNPANVWAIAFGCIIGWGSFVNPGKKFLPNSGVAGTTIAMILGALCGLIVVALHWPNIIRLVKGNERKTNLFGKGRKE